MTDVRTRCMAVALAAGLALTVGTAPGSGRAAAAPGVPLHQEPGGTGRPDDSSTRWHGPGSTSDPGRQPPSAGRGDWHGERAHAGQQRPVRPQVTRWAGSPGRLPATSTPTASAAQSQAAIAPAVTPAASTPAATNTGDIGALLAAQADAAGVDPALVKAVAWQESGWRMVIASDGGIGIMQLMPATVAWIETTVLGQVINPYNATDNVRAGVALLHYYLNVLGSARLALAAYHQGLQSVQTTGISAATAQYIANVLALQQQFAR